MSDETREAIELLNSLGIAGPNIMHAEQGMWPDAKHSVDDTWDGPGTCVCRREWPCEAMRLGDILATLDAARASADCPHHSDGSVCFLDKAHIHAAKRASAPGLNVVRELLDEVAFMRSCIASGEKLNGVDLDRQNDVMARARALTAKP